MDNQPKTTTQPTQDHQAEEAIDDDAPALAKELASEPPEAIAATPVATPPKKRRGFAAMDPEKIRAISRRGGVAAHAKGTAHRFTHEEAREAGRKGGNAAHLRRGRGPTPSAPPR